MNDCYFFPLLEMHYSAFVIIGTKRDIETEVAAILAPFDESLEVAPYKRYLDDEEIEHMARRYGIAEDDLPGLATKMHDWNGFEGDADEVGVFAWKTSNPLGKWDWYEIGGGWNNSIGGRNVVKAGALLQAPYLKDCLPFSTAAPRGEWREVETLVDLGWSKFESVRKTEARWLLEVKQVLHDHAQSRVVCVDLHR